MSDTARHHRWAQGEQDQPDRQRVVWYYAVHFVDPRCQARGKALEPTAEAVAQRYLRGTAERRLEPTSSESLVPLEVEGRVRGWAEK